MNEGDVLVQVTGYMASAITTGAMFPQARVIYMTSDTKSISLLMYIALITANILWIIYGVMKNEWPIIGGNGLNLIMSLYICFKKIWNIRASRGDGDGSNEEGIQ